MRRTVSAAALVAVLAALVGCGGESSTHSVSGANSAPAPVDSGAGGGKKGPRVPNAPPK
jgi:predicted small lipoprotein YifL